MAALLNGMVGVDPLDPATADSQGHVRTDYRRFLDEDGLRGARIGVWRREYLWRDETTARRMEGVLEVFEERGATLVDPVQLPNWKEATGHHVSVMFLEFEHGINTYLSGLTNSEVRTLADVVAFNAAHEDEELGWHNQGLLEGCVGSLPLPNPEYRIPLPRSERIARADFGRAFRRHRLDAIVAPTYFQSWPINLIDGDPRVRERRRRCVERGRVSEPHGAGGVHRGVADRHLVPRSCLG